MGIVEQGLDLVGQRDAHPVRALLRPLMMAVERPGVKAEDEALRYAPPANATISRAIDGDAGAGSHFGGVCVNGSFV